MSQRITIFDTTLRDGEQSPGASMTHDEKLVIARGLTALGVDVIEAGFAAVSGGDFNAVKAVAEQCDGPIIASLSRCIRSDITACAAALRPATKRRIHLFLATSPIHRQFKLGLSRDQVVARAVEAVTMASEFFDDIEFSAEDAARTEREFLREVVERVIAAGVTVINIPDTVGFAVPEQYAELVTDLKTNVSNINRAIISVHCHDDLGLSVANSLAALRAGATQVECTINGIGERAGNCALEEVVMALRTRGDFFDLVTGIDTKKLYQLSRLVAAITGMGVPRNKAVVGDNAFAHEAGIHQHGVLAHRETYEIMRAEDVGQIPQSLVLGKHSGRHALKAWADDHGYDVDELQLKQAFNAFKVEADRRKVLSDPDLHRIFSSVTPVSDQFIAAAARAALSE